MLDALLSNETLSSVGKYALKKPLEIKVTYDECEQVWVVNSLELGICGCGSTYCDAINSLINEFLYLVKWFTTFSDEELVKDLILIKMELKKFIDIETFRENLRDEWGCKK